MSTGINFYSQQSAQQSGGLMPLQRHLTPSYAGGMTYVRTTSTPDSHSTTSLVKSSRLPANPNTNAQLSTSLSSRSGNEKPNGHVKRSSKLPEIITSGLRRSRTTSLPHRPHTSDGHTNRSTISANTEMMGDDTAPSAASSSLASVVEVDPFAAHPYSSSFIPYDSPGMSQHSLNSSRPRHTTQMSTQYIVHPGPSSPSQRRRGSILVAATGALSSISSSFSRKKRVATVAPTPIVLSEVIEISSSSNARLREHEDEERERLREVAAQSLGLGPVLLEDKLSRLNSGEGAMFVDSERERGRGSRLGRFSSDEDEEDEEDSDDYHPPESDITGFSSISVPIHTPVSSPAIPHQLQSISALTHPFHPSTTPAAAPFTQPSRARSGSIAPSLHSYPHHTAHGSSHTFSRPGSTTPSSSQPIPAFPATYASIKPYVQHQAMLPKYYPPPSLLMFALSKQWKSRFIVLSSPTAGSSITSPRPSGSSYSPTTTSSAPNPGSVSVPAALRPSSGPAVSYLHLFKGPGSEERELERLEINDDSVVCISDEEVGGKRNVVKVGGIDVGAMKKEWNLEESGRTMWCLFIINQAEAQKWIEGVKGTVLSQRSVRAGLGTVSHHTNGVEPRGDLDVMLSMRAQGILPSSASDAGGSSASLTPRVQSPVTPQQTTFASPFDEATPPPVEHRGLSPPPTLSRSHSRTYAVSPTPSTRQHNSAVSALKGLFTRPRSPSNISGVSTQSAIPNGHDAETLEQQEDSFGAVGTSLLKLRSNSVSSERQFSPTSSAFGSKGPGSALSSPVSPAAPRLPTPTTEALQPHGPHILDRKILTDSDRLQLVETSCESESGVTTGSFVPGRLSALGMRDSDCTIRLTGSPSLQPPPRKRALTSVVPAGRTSLDSISPPYTYNHANGSAAESLGVKQLNGTIPIPKANGSHKRTSWSSYTSSGSTDNTSLPEAHTRRRSLRNANGATLTPLSSSPVTPSPLSSRPSTASRHPYAADAPVTPTSGSSSPHSPVLDLRPLSPKRMSGSSTNSFTTANTSHSRSPVAFSHKPLASHRASMPPPPRPAPLSALPLPPSQYHYQLEEAPASPVVMNRNSQSAPSTRGTFREILTHRSHRVSLSPPTHPPNSALPPRPDDPGFVRPTHRKSASTSSVSAPPLYTIPASPTPLESPFPPPNGPLPPPPTPPPPTSPPDTTRRHSMSLKRRLRILSAPGPSPPRTPTPPMISHTPEPAGSFDEPTPPVIPPSFISDFVTSPASIGEPITTLQNDPNFLSMSLPSTPSITPPQSSPPLASSGVRALPIPTRAPPMDMLSFDDSFGSPTSVNLTSLSPPPRRGSKRISTPDKERLEADVMKLPHGVPSIMDIRVRRNVKDTKPPHRRHDTDDEDDDEHDDEDDNNDETTDECDHVVVKSDDDDVDQHSSGRNGHYHHHHHSHPLIQVHNVDLDDGDFSLTPGTDDSHVNDNSFNLSPPAPPHQLGDTVSVISLVEC